MSARQIRRGDIVRSKITGRTGPVLRVEQYDHGTPRITAELTKGYDTGVPGHHLELVRSADDGRVHDVALAELLARDEDASIERVDPEDPTSMVVPVPGDQVLMADGGTARVTARRMDGDVLSLQVQRPRMGYAEWVGVEEIAGVPEPEVAGPTAVSSQAGLSAIRHGVVQSDTAAAVVVAALAWEESYDQSSGTHSAIRTGHLMGAVHAHRAAIGGAS